MPMTSRETAGLVEVCHPMGMEGPPTGYGNGPPISHRRCFSGAGREKCKENQTSGQAD